MSLTWIVCTGDPVAGTGVVAHITAMFGLGDLYAAIAIPASLGLDAVHKKFLEDKLKCLYEKWFARKQGPVNGLIEANLTSPCTSPCDELLNQTAEPFERFEKAIDEIHASGEVVK